MAEKKYSEKANEILNAAELRMRQGGFDAVSYRDLAVAVGIKASSVHYHFPQKADLGRAVVERYTANVLAFLGEPDHLSESVEVRIRRLCSVYQQALVRDEVPCLCCVLGAESLDLPDVVSDAVGRFFIQMIAWTEKALEGHPDGEALAKHVVSTLQGTMITALTLKQPQLLQDAEPYLLRLVD